MDCSNKRDTNCVDLNENLNQHPKIEAFMVGQAVAILDEIVHQVVIEIFPKKCFFYKTEKTFITPFVSLKEVDRPIYDSSRFNLKNLSRIKDSYGEIKNYYGKITKIVNFLKSKRSSSK